MLEGLPSEVLKTIDTPVGRAPCEYSVPEIDALFASNFHVVAPQTGDTCPMCKLAPRNPGDLTCGSSECRREREIFQ